MSYNPATDFVALWRVLAGAASKLEMPGLDYVVAALSRAGLITLSVSATAPVVSQSTTAWLQAAVPSNSAEGVMRLWDPVAATYVAATPALFFKMLETAAGQNGVSWFTVTGGPPSNIVGNNGDFAIRTDEPGGIYGPKASGVWPANPIPGTTDLIGSAQFDATFGTAEGQLIYRGPAVWQGLAVGAANTLLVSSGALPSWESVSALLDAVFGGVRGALLYRDVALWAELGPGSSGQVLKTNGPSANPSWVGQLTEFTSGTTMLFQQTSAPVGWTKQVVLNDYGLRVTSGAAGITGGTGFSTVFAQTAVGNHTLSVTELPAHTHNYSLAVAGPQKPNSAGTTPFDGYNTAATDGGTGGGSAHTHSVSLQLAYVDVIIAVKN